MSHVAPAVEERMLRSCRASLRRAAARASWPGGSARSSRSSVRRRYGTWGALTGKLGCRPSGCRSRVDADVVADDRLV